MFITCYLFVCLYYVLLLKLYSVLFCSVISNMFAFDTSGLGNMNKGNEHKANFSKFPRFYIGGQFKSLYLEKCTLTYSNFGIKCLVIYF